MGGYRPSHTVLFAEKGTRKDRAGLEAELVVQSGTC